MAESLGKMLEILDIPEVSNLYQTSIRKMQPAELLQRLESENVSTRGHMSELRGRLLRLEVQKSHPHVQVPWYPEDNVSEKIEEEEEVNKPGSERWKDHLLTKFFQLTRRQEKELQQIRDLPSTPTEHVISDQIVDKAQTASGENSGVQKEVSFHAVIEKLDSTMKAYLAQWGDVPFDFQQMQSMRQQEEKYLPFPSDESEDESQIIFDENLDEEDRETTRTIDSDASIVTLRFHHDLFGKMDNNWGDISATNVYHIPEIDSNT